MIRLGNFQEKFEAGAFIVSIHFLDVPMSMRLRKENAVFAYLLHTFQNLISFPKVICVKSVSFAATPVSTEPKDTVLRKLTPGTRI